MDDWQLIQSYALERSEASFQALVDRYAGLVYASALRQVRQPQLAQDVAQAVFILFARKACKLRRGIVLSGWLFQATRFVAARALRADLRRQRREQEAFDMQQLSSTDDAWRHMSPLIDEALDELGRTDRDAILLRYVEGRSLREVSQALGVTEEAAKKRVARAVERLRQVIGQNGVALAAATITSALTGHASAALPLGLSSVWGAQALAAPLAGGGAGALVTATLQAWRWNTLKWLAGSVAAVLLTVTAILLTANPDFGREAMSPAGRSSLAVAETQPNPAVAAPDVSVDMIRQQGRAHLNLRVVSADDGQGITNAPMFLSVWRLGTVENHWNLMTDARGFCEVAFEWDASRIDVGVLKAGWAARYVTWPSEGSSGIPAEYVLRLEPVTNSIGGIVRDPSGRPLADVQVWFGGHDSGDSAHRERPRERFGFLHAIPSSRTDAEGRWSIGSIPPAHRGFQLEARHPEFADTILITSPAQQSLAEIQSAELKQLWNGQLLSTMKAAFTLAGTVLNEQGKPVAGARVQQRDDGKGFSTDASGRFQVPKLAEGTWPCTVTAEGYAPSRITPRIGPAMQPVVVTLQTGAVLRARVVDEAGFPVPGAEIGLVQWGQNRFDFEWREKTDFDGRIEWTSAPRDVELELFARKDGFCWTRDLKVRATGEEHTIVLHQSLVVYGRVVDAEAGGAVRDFKAMPGYGAFDRFHDSGQRWYEGETVRGTNGMFKLVFVERTYPWSLRLTAHGYEDWVSEPLTNRVQAVLDIAMRRARATEALRGVVLLPDGNPAASAQVALLTFEHNVILRNQAFTGNARWLRRTGHRGEFAFSVNRLAHSVAAVNGAGYAHMRITEPGKEVTLRLQPWGRVEGVVEESAATLGVTSVELYDPAADNYQGRVSLLGSYSVKPKGNLAFVFEHVPPGKFTVFVNSMNNIPFHHGTPLVVQAGETTRVVIRELPGTRVTGRLIPPPDRAIDWKKDFVVAQLHADLPQASAFVSSGPTEELPMRELDFWTSRTGREHINTPRVYSALVREDGSFASLENLPPGKYRFTTVFKDASVTRHIMIGDDQPEVLQLGDVQLR